MSKLASILACCAVASLFSLGAQALPGSPVPAPFAASDITPVSACGPGYTPIQRLSEKPLAMGRFWDSS
jgi:hypothetical protein